MDDTPSPFTVVSPRRGRRYLLVFTLLLTLGGLGIFVMASLANTPPLDFPVGTPVEVVSGESVADIVEKFVAAKVVRSDILLYTILLTHYTPSDIKASTYVFDKPYTTFEVAKKLATGDFTSNLVRLTHREGERVTELAVVVTSVLPAISPEEFINLALPYEGYLWPETYFLPPHFTANDVVMKMRDDYDAFMAPRRAAIAASGLSEADVVTLASIIEREANSEESMKMVAGILLNRLMIGMPLQADASIEYVLDKPLGELVPGDLAIDTPYNSYLYTGLPPTPIGNPGAVAIDAVLAPTPSDYMFYITGEDGTFHYSVTYEDHKRNIARYLR